MYNFTTDLHTHTLVSHHAFSTVTENAYAAKRIGLYGFGKTDHSISLTDGAHEWHFRNTMSHIPKFIDGVRVFRGVEVNVMNPAGELDVPSSILKRLEWVIASIHEPCMPNPSVDEVTQAWLCIAKNPYIDCIGHCDAPLFDHETVIKEFGHRGKIVELNKGSTLYRSLENVKKIALLCAKHAVMVAVNSDAHYMDSIGDFGCIPELLEEIGFPKELILNEGDPEKVERYVEERYERIKLAEK